jgi:membrane associated rhomboid family serine protease
MPGCNYKDCKESINYLPFKCKYCGRTFCTKHRLPENHDCDGIKGSKESPLPISPISSIKNSSPSEPDDSTQYFDLQTLEDLKSGNNRAFKSEEEPQRYERRRFNEGQARTRQKRFSGPDVRLYQERSGPAFIPNGKMNVTYYLMVGNLIFFFLSMIPDIQPYLYLNSTLFFQFGFIWPLFTAMFIVGDFISLLFRMIILYFFGRSIELRYGPKFMAMMFFLSGLICGVVSVLLQFLFQFTVDPSIGTYLMVSSGGMFIGFITLFVLLFGPNTQMQFFFYFFPIRLKAKYIFYIVAGIEVLMIIIGLFIDLTMVVSSLGNLSAIIAGIIMFKQLIR